MILEEIFSDICKGYSEIISGKKYFIKHQSFLDQSKIANLYKKYIDEGLSIGLKKEQDIITDLIKSDIWPGYKEQAIKSCLADLKLMESSKKSIKDKMEINPLYDAILELREKYSSLLDERSKLVLNSVEDYASCAIRPSQISSLFYLDESLSSKAFSDDDLLYLDEENYNQILIDYYRVVQNFSHDKIEEICINDTFYSMFSICNNIYDLYGKPIVELTTNQINLSKTSKIFVKILDECGGIPEEFSTIPDKVVMWLYLKRNDGVVTDTEIQTEENKLRSLFNR